MKICIVGAGYVGLVSGACFSEFGWRVTCVDVDPARIEMLRAGQTPIYEPGLSNLLEQNIRMGRISFTTDLAEPVAEADLIFLAVGTPMRRGDGHADLKYVYQAAEEIARYLTGYTVIVTKSTVPVGTSRDVEKRIRAIRSDADFDVASNPEFLREGSAIFDFMHPDRILIGVESERAEKVLRDVYRPLSLRDAPVISVSRESAEVAKYAANAFLAMKISFINEISDFCEQVGASVQEVATAIGRDKRIGDKFLHPGPGYGGSCFPKDVSALIRSATDANSPITLIEQVVAVNNARKNQMVDRVARAAGSLAGKEIGVLGVTFKPNTDDMREAPSLVIIPGLTAGGARVRAYDPKGMAAAQDLLADVTWCESAMAALKGADILLLLTEWNEFRALDLKAVRQIMRGDVLVDLRNVFDAQTARHAGFAYHGIGCGTEVPELDRRTARQ